VLDLMMPDMNGFELAEAIKSDQTIASVALVMLQPFGKRRHDERARQVLIEGYLPKPVRQCQLHDCLTAVMAASSSTEPAPPAFIPFHFLNESEIHDKDKTFSSVRILVAEDDLVNQEVALGQLYSLGYRAAAVPNGRELLKALENDPVDIILIDCHMPEMDGFAATAEIRRREGTARHTTIIAMTANAFDGDREACLTAGMDDYLSKPVKSDVLRLKLERWSKPRGSEKGLSEDNEPARQNEVSVINRAQLANLRQFQPPGKADFVTKMIDLFFDRTASGLEALHSAQITNDVVEIQRLAHRLRGSSANLGAIQMAALFKELESKDPIKDPSELLAELENEFELVREALKVERRAMPE
jgi:two-component system, sensor histidine kinase and response regulator